jgi:hypothetical protein
MTPVTMRSREWGLAAVALAPLALLLIRPPIPQELKYHELADTRTWFGIPNFPDVASNLPFLAIGAAGVLLCSGGKATGASRSWTVFFLGVALTFLGSACYHWHPDNATLVWDRLPITISFMGLFAGMVCEHVKGLSERQLLLPAVAIGIASVAWWAWTDDLRVYIWVQAAPLVCIVYILIVYPAKYTHRRYLAYALACYALAKAAEFQDGAIYAITSRALSGHTLKHLLAAVGTGLIYLMLSRRKQNSEKVPVGVGGN